MFYKLGSRIGILDPDLFEWNLCLLDDRGNVVTYVPLGDYYSNHPIVKKTKELVKLLNGEN